MLGTITDVRIKYELQKKEQDAKELHQWLVNSCKDSNSYNALHKTIKDRMAV